MCSTLFIWGRKASSCVMLVVNFLLNWSKLYTYFGHFEYTCALCQHWCDTVASALVDIFLVVCLEFPVDFLPGDFFSNSRKCVSENTAPRHGLYPSFVPVWFCAYDCNLLPPCSPFMGKGLKTCGPLKKYILIMIGPLCKIKTHCNRLISLLILRFYDAENIFKEKSLLEGFYFLQDGSFKIFLWQKDEILIAIIGPMCNVAA